KEVSTHCPCPVFTGPYRHRRGFDLVAQAMSGIMSFTGERADGPHDMGEVYHLHPGQRAAERSFVPAHGKNLFAAPLRLALVQECVQTFAEVPAHVTHEDQVLAFLAG